MAIRDHDHRGYKYKRSIDGGRECEECHRRARLEDKRSTMRRLEGTTNPVVTDPHEIDTFKRRVKTLTRKHGYSMKYIAKRIGISRWRLCEIMKPGQMPTGLRQATIQGLESLVVEATTSKPRSRFKSNQVDSELAQAAIKGLMLRGYTQGWIAEQIGTTTQQVSAILRQARVTTERDAALTRLAKKYGTTDGPSHRTRAIAQNRGYESTAMRDEFL